MNHILIKQPKISGEISGKSRLSAEVSIAGETNTIWFEVEETYARYLCVERSDAFVIGLLPVAMRRGLDIVSEAPISERLEYQLRSTLLPLLARYGKNVHEVKITAPIATEPIQNAGGVGAGISCGVDSLHIVKNHGKDDKKGLALTHLVLNNVGAFGVTGASNQHDWTINLARQFCEEYGYELVLTNSNIFDVVKLDFEQNHTYFNTFAILCLQKLWKVFYYGSWGVDFEEGYTVKNNELKDCAAYDILSLDCFSTESLKIYSEGAAFDRFDKTAHIADFEPAHKYLQVCVSGTGKNCGHCFKCNRTLLTLDALGKLDSFRRVFDIDAFRKNRKWYLTQLYRAVFSHSDKMLGRVYAVLKKDISGAMKLRAIWEYGVYRFKVALRPTFEKLGLLKPLS